MKKGNQGYNGHQKRKNESLTQLKREWRFTAVSSHIQLKLVPQEGKKTNPIQITRKQKHIKLVDHLESPSRWTWDRGWVSSVVLYVAVTPCQWVPFGFPFINMHKGQVHHITHYFNLQKKWVPVYVISAFRHTYKCLPPYVISVSLIQQEQQACLAIDLQALYPPDWLNYFVFNIKACTF